MPSAVSYRMSVYSPAGVQVSGSDVMTIHSESVHSNGSLAYRT
jgi:hypothetical protein